MIFPELKPLERGSSSNELVRELGLLPIFGAVTAIIEDLVTLFFIAFYKRKNWSAASKSDILDDTE